MTFDFLLGFATPGCRVVKTAPGGIKGWIRNAMWRRVIAPDGFVYMVAVRLLGVTAGVTITRECDNSSLPQFSQFRSPPIPKEAIDKALAMQAAAQAAHTAQQQASRSNGTGSTGTPTSPVSGT